MIDEIFFHSWEDSEGKQLRHCCLKQGTAALSLEAQYIEMKIITHVFFTSPSPFPVAA